MAKKEATLLLVIKEKGKNVISGLKNAFAALKANALALIAGFGAVGAAISKLALDADKFNVVRKSFENLSRSQGQDADRMLKQMKELSAGTISELELMQQANNALLLGLPVDRFGDMLTIARASAKATGQSMDFMLNSIVTGLGRGSKLMLDNLGILISQEKANKKYAESLGIAESALTDAQRKQAFINEALEVGLKNTQAMGEMNESVTDKWERLKAGIANTAIELGQVFIPAAKSTFDAISDITTSVSDLLKKYNLIQRTNDKTTDSVMDYRKAIIEAGKELFLLEEQLKNSGTAFASSNDVLVKGTGQLQQAIEKQKQKIQELEDAKKQAIENEKSRLAQEQEIANQRKVAEEERAKEVAENKVIADEEALIQKQLTGEREALLEKALQDKKLQQQIQAKNKEILNETDKSKKLILIKQKKALQEKAIKEEEKKQTKKINDEIKQQESNMEKFHQMVNNRKVNNASQVFGQIATLQNSHNKTMAKLGKAAAIANIVINTAQGISLAFRTFPFPLSTAIAGIVAAAGAAQIATVNGVQLAEGGIVRATQGGIQATIGEGGQDEAVIPLPDGASSIGNNISIVVNGGLLGDQASAREFALAIDSELLKLRQDNESFAFDEGVV